MLKSARALKAYFERTLKITLEFLTEAPSEGGKWSDVQFSMALSQYGLWGVRTSKPLSKENSAEISDTFNSILGDDEKRHRKTEHLVRLEGKLTRALEELPSNVVQLRRPHKTTSQPSAARRAHLKRWILRQDCLIEAKDLREIHKMATELHSHGSRYAFVDHGDVDPASRLSLQSLLAFGPITLHVSNLLTLSPEEQAVLYGLTRMDSEDRPLVMAGITLPYSELRCISDINLELIESLSRAYIKLSRPFSEYRDQGLIHYFLDSLCDRPT